MPDPGPSVPGQGHRRPPRRGPLSSLCDRLVLGLHRLADRFEWVPPEFGADSQVDADDGRAILAEWIHWVRRWADHNPGEVFALKIGGAMLLAAVLLLWLAIAVFL